MCVSWLTYMRVCTHIYIYIYIYMYAYIHTTYTHTYIQIPARSAQELSAAFSKLQDSRALPPADRKIKPPTHETNIEAGTKPLFPNLFRTASLDRDRVKGFPTEDFDLSVHTHFGAGIRHFGAGTSAKLHLGDGVGETL